MFKILHCTGHWEIERSPQYFPYILDYLNHEKLDIWTMSTDQVKVFTVPSSTCTDDASHYAAF